MKRDKALLIRHLYLLLGYAVFDYYNESIKSVYLKTQDLLKQANVTSIIYKYHLFKQNEIIITAYRPGLLIGKQGCIWEVVKSNFDKESDKRISRAKLIIKEDKNIDSLYSFMTGLNFI